MGYNASGSGTVKVKSEPTIEMLDKLEEAFEGVWFNRKNMEIEVSTDGKYHDDIVVDALNTLAPITIEGMITFCGEDESFWRFVFEDGEQTQTYGVVVFDDELNEAQKNKEEFLGQIIDIMQDDVVDNPQGDLIEGEWFDDIYNKLDDLMKSWKVFI